MPPSKEELLTNVKLLSTKPKEDFTPEETSTQSTSTTPFREPRILSKFRQKTENDQINIKPSIKQRTISPIKKSVRLTTTRVREITVLPTSTFRTRGN